ncbi:hypothetical protein SDC9_167206 [bioreactor metagenome]|uniref:Uncharacterized protein n=1 Tax=bioreactor metagenome TaxID=1076179 RepID=A0A645G6U5_9ZZZZ
MGTRSFKTIRFNCRPKKRHIHILAGQSYLEPIEYGLTNIEKPFVINGKKLRQGERVKFLASKLK